MSTVDPVIHSRLITLGDEPPLRNDDCGLPRRELARFEWRPEDHGDPLALVEAFLASHGLPVTDLSRPAGPLRGPHDAQRVCGAALLLGAGAAARIVHADPGRDTPVPAVPELVAVVYGHTTRSAPPGDRGVAAPPAGSARLGTGAVAAPPPASQPVAAPERMSSWSIGQWKPSWTPADHATAVDHVRGAIARGDVYQVNLVGHATAAYRGDPGLALRRVAHLPGARYGGLLAGAGWAVACASPETLVEVRGGRAVTRPIKGTRPATVEGRAQLLASAKERAEHVMIVDLERNDLARVAVTGSVRVDELFAISQWVGLWHAESVVSARLLHGVGLAELLRAVCPGGSVTGAPKLAALRKIAALEPVGRGPSMGAFGWVGHDGIDLGLTIRTVAADAGHLHVWAGGGVTWDSDAAEEVAEAAAKADPLKDALRSG